MTVPAEPATAGPPHEPRAAPEFGVVSASPGTVALAEEPSPLEDERSADPDWAWAAPASARQQVAVAHIFRRIMCILSHPGRAGRVVPAGRSGP